MINDDAIDPGRIARRLRAMRKASGLTQSAVARAAAMPRPIVSRVERGKHMPSLVTLRRYCDAVGARVVDVFAEDA